VDQSARSAVLPLDSAPQSVRHAREFVRLWLTVEAPDGPVDDVVLVVSELVTNAIRHGGDSVTVELVRLEHGCRVEVRDSGLTAFSPEAEAPCDSRERGRGLAIVSSLATLGQTLDTEGTLLTAELTW